MIVRDRFWLRVDYEFVRIAAAGFAIERCAPLTENLLQFFQWNSCDFADRFESQRKQRSFGDFADARNFSHGQWCQELRFASGSAPNESARFRLFRSNFRDQPRRTKPAGTGKSCRARNRSQEFVGCSERRTVQAFRAGQIEISLVDRNHFDDWRKLAKDRRDAIAPFAVFVVVAVEENSVRAELACGSQRHCRVHAKFSRFVTRRSYNA